MYVSLNTFLRDVISYKKLARDEPVAFKLSGTFLDSLNTQERDKHKSAV
jgi:hypothetical protein